MDVKTLIAALAEVKAMCAKKSSCQGCPFDLSAGCIARVPEPDMDDYPMNWAVSLKEKK